MKTRFGTAGVVLCAFLLLQAAGFLMISRDEAPPDARPLRDLPSAMGDWRTLHEGVFEERVQEALKADDLLSRVYTNAGGETASLYIAYFSTQRTGQAPHSPKNCLPGSGWVPSESDFMEIQVPGRSVPLEVNRYIVSKGESRSLVLYWYQSRDRAVASEYAAKVHLVLDSLRYNRSDTALVRVLVPLGEEGEERAAGTARRFVLELVPSLTAGFPQFRSVRPASPA